MHALPIGSESCSFRLSRRAAHWAARSGVEWALHEAVASSWLPGAVSTTLNLGGCVLSGFQVVVLCTETSHQHARRVTYESLDSLGSHFRGHRFAESHRPRGPSICRLVSGNRSRVSTCCPAQTSNERSRKPEARGICDVDLEIVAQARFLARVL